MPSNVAEEEQAIASADEDDKKAPGRGRDRPSVGAYAQVAALLHESRRQAPMP